MEAKKSKVKNVQGNGTFENSYGVDLGNGTKGFYKFDYEFEDGTHLSANHKETPAPFKIGDEVEYVVKGTNEYGSYGKVSKPNDGNFPSGGYNNKSYSKSNSTASFAVAYAKDIEVAYVGKGQECDVNRLLQNAERINTWIKNNQ